MATIVITTTPEEQEKVMKAIDKIGKTTVPMSKIAREAGLSENRVRYVITDLVDAGKVKRTPTKAYNAHYVRYSYEVVRKEHK